MQLGSSNISLEASHAVQEMIVAGDIPDGGRINEVALAKQLGISRTPLREGLGRLVADGTLTVAPRRGFFVSPLSIPEFEQLYDIRPILDPQALSLSGLPTAEQISKLKSLNRKLQRTKKASEAIEIDNAWHRTLLANCPNKILLELIEQIIARTRRYEHALFRETDNIWQAGDDHDHIITALDAGNLDEACDGLRKNMQSGKQPIIDWLQKREKDTL